MCQRLKLVDHENVVSFCIRRYESILQLMLPFVKVSFSTFNSFLIVLFLFIFIYFPSEVVEYKHLILICR